MWKNQPLVQPRLWFDHVAITHCSAQLHVTSSLLDFPLKTQTTTFYRNTRENRSRTIRLEFKSYTSGSIVIVGSAIWYHTLCISVGLYWLRFMIGEDDPKIYALWLVVPVALPYGIFLWKPRPRNFIGIHEKTHGWTIRHDFKYYAPRSIVIVRSANRIAHYV